MGASVGKEGEYPMIHKLKPEPKRFLIRRASALPIRWNGVEPLPAGVHLPEEIKKRINLRSIQGTRTLLSADGGIQIELLTWPERILPDQIPESLSFLLPKPREKDDSDIKRPFWISFAGLLLLLLSISLLPKPADTAGENTVERAAVIPPRYAKILLSTPGRRGGGKGTLRAFQSPTVQRSMRELLKNSFATSKWLSSGVALRDLSKSMQGTEKSGSLSGALARLAAGSGTGSTRIGTSAGYAEGSLPVVSGQGQGSKTSGLSGGGAAEEGLTRDEVARVIHSHMNEIRYCYETGILRNPTLSGKLLVDFKINGSGRVPAAGITEASLQDEGVRRCLLGKLREWQFPLPRGGVQVAVSYPFIFKSLTR